MKGASPLFKGFVGMVTVVAVIVGLVFLGWKLGVFANPCWNEVMEGMEPLAMNRDIAPRMVFDVCLVSFVVTSKFEECDFFCSKESDEDVAEKCSKRCYRLSDDSPDSDPLTVIIAVPVKKNVIENTMEAVRNRKFGWLVDGKTEVFYVECDVESVNGIEECSEEEGTWTCPYSEETGKRTYSIDIENPDETTTCTLTGRGVSGLVGGGVGGGGGDAWEE